MPIPELCRGSWLSRYRLKHDLRHNFAVRTLLQWYWAGDDVEARLPILSTYLGHRDPRSTYWYLSAVLEERGDQPGVEVGPVQGVGWLARAVAFQCCP